MVVEKGEGAGRTLTSIEVAAAGVVGSARLGRRRHTWLSVEDVRETLGIEAQADDVVIGDVLRDLDHVHSDHRMQQVGGGVDPIDTPPHPTGAAGAASA